MARDILYTPSGGGFCQLRVSERATLNLSVSRSLRRSEHRGVRQPSLQEFKVSAAGQMSLPASARRRWALMEGGVVQIADLQFGLLLLPLSARAHLLKEALPRDRLQAHIEELADDPDLGM